LIIAIFLGLAGLGVVIKKSYPYGYSSYLLFVVCCSRAWGYVYGYIFPPYVGLYYAAPPYLSDTYECASVLAWG
jgi:hypothetical protein